MHDGIVSLKAGTGKVTALTQPSNVPSSDAFPYQTPLFPTSLIFPTQPLSPIASNQVFAISYKGLTQIDNQNVHDIVLQRGSTVSSATTKVPHPTGRSRELFIDSTSLQVVIVRETVPRNVLQEVHYSNYQVVNGISMPLTISEFINSQPFWTIQLSQITFNSGLQDSTFALQ